MAAIRALNRPKPAAGDWCLGDVACAVLVGLSLGVLPPRGGAPVRAAAERPPASPRPALIRAAPGLAVLPPPPLDEALPREAAPPGMVLVEGHGAVPSFFMDRTEVTAGSYAACRSCPQPDPGTIEEGLLGPRERRGALAGKCNLLLLQRQPERARHPMNCVSALEARRYCTAQGKRLPTEAEWQLAAGGPERRSYPWGEEAPQRRKGLCWERIMSCEVGTSDADRTPSGLLDLAGNVQEWVEFGSSGQALFRGGGWAASEPESLLNRHRPQQVLRTERRQNTVGFRCVKDLPGG